MSPAEHFAKPLWLAALALVPWIWLAGGLHQRSRERRLSRLLGPRVDLLAIELDPVLRKRRRTLASIALGLALLALAEPRWGTGRDPARADPIDLVVCLDVSRSMLARDLPPSRLERARTELEDLVARARGERAALVVFAGEARLSVPLTRDLDSFLALALAADPDLVLRGGSDPGAALELALELLEARAEGGADRERDGVAPAAVLLLSDGEDQAARGPQSAARLLERGVPVHALGLGTAAGGKIPVLEQGRERFLRDRAELEVIARLDAPALRRIAAAGGGRYLDARESARPLVELYEQDVRAGASRARALEERRRRPGRYQWPLLGAFALWMLALCSTDRRRT